MTEIKISYTSVPQGQLGGRPQKINLNEICRITSPDTGELVVEFLGRTPLASGQFIKKDVDFLAHKSGHFAFNCVFTPPDGKPIKIDGGEIEIGT